jgi:RNA polymerase sigma-70 factor, ECF subfamily
MSAPLDCRPFGAEAWGVTDLSDDDLMHFVRTQDDREAFAELVRRHSGAALQIARRRLGGDSHRAEDLVQELFLRVYTHRCRYQASARFGGYLRRILTNLCASQTRRQRARPAQSLGDLEPPSEVDSNRSEALTHQRRALAGALATLPELYQEALGLRYQEDLSCRQIAARLGRSEQAIKSLLFRARESLRRSLVEEVGSLEHTDIARIEPRLGSALCATAA